MSVPDFYEAVVRWPHPEPNDVIVTGEFDAWSSSTHLTRSANGFEGVVRVPWGQKIAYKYIVDGRWTTTDDQPTEIDTIGNLNNVLNTPARPATPKAPTLSTPEPPSKPAGQLNGIIATAKSAAVAMVEAIAPGTTETPVESPTAEPAKAEEAAAPPAPAEPAPVEAHDKATTVKAENGAAVEAPHAEKPSDVTPTSAPDAVVTPGGELTSEAVLPPAAQEAPKAPDVPVTVLPLAAAAEEPLAQGGDQKPLETVVVDGSATAGTAASASLAAVEPSTHTPVVAPEETAGASEGTEKAPEPVPVVTTAQPDVEASTHTPVPPVESEKTNGTAGAEAPVSAAAEPAKAATNGTNGTHAPEPAAVPLPPTPASNGKPSAATTPQGTPLKEKRHAFPSFGRNRRQSSSTASMSTNGPDEHGSVHQSPSRRGSQKDSKRRTSFFGKIKEIFSDEHHRAKK